MTLRLTLSGGRGFYKALAEGEKPIARAATAAVREAAELSTAGGRQCCGRWLQPQIAERAAIEGLALSRHSACELSDTRFKGAELSINSGRLTPPNGG
jgi:hypothetical protein